MGAYKERARVRAEGPASIDVANSREAERGALLKDDDALGVKGVALDVALVDEGCYDALEVEELQRGRVGALSHSIVNALEEKRQSQSRRRIRVRRRLGQGEGQAAVARGEKLSARQVIVMLHARTLTTS